MECVVHNHNLPSHMCSCANKRAQAAAIKACVGVVESLRKLFPDKKLPELVGPENLSLLAKTVVTVRVSVPCTL